MDLYPFQPLAPLEKERPIESTSECRRCPLGSGHRCVLPEIGGVGGTLFVGERPGAREDRSGSPFSGESGRLLRDVVPDLFEGPVSYANAVQCYGGKEPTEHQIEVCRAHLAATFQQVKPDRIVCLGSSAIYAVLGRTPPIMSVGGGVGWLYRTRTPVYYAMNPAHAVRNRFHKARFHRDLERAAKDEGRIWLPPWEGEAIEVGDEQAAMECYEAARVAGSCSFDSETYGSVHDPDFRLLCLAVTTRDRCGSQAEAWVWPEESLRPDAAACAPLRAMLVDPKIRKDGQNLKYDVLAAECGLGLRIQGHGYDTRLVRKLLDSDVDGRLETMAELVGMGDLKEESEAALTAIRAGAKRRRKRTASGQAALLDEERPEMMEGRYIFSLLPRDVLHRRCALDAIATARIVELLAPSLEAHKNIGHVWREVVSKTTASFASVERWGVAVDRKALEAADMQLAIDVDGAGKRLRAYADVDFDSPKQVADLLYGRLNLPVLGKTDGGAPSTNKDALEALRGRHPIVADLLSYREATHHRKIYGGGLDGTGGLIAHIRADGRIHSTYNLAGARTGRLSSENPNLQNIPRVGDEGSSAGRKIRDAFVAPSGKLLLSADYSQLEIRIAALLSGDTRMKAIFRAGEDFHQRTAEGVSKIAWGVDPDKVTKEHRYKAKAVNFGCMYGKTPRTFAEEWKISETAAQRIFDAILGQFPTYRDWMEQCVAYTRRTGCSWTWWNGQRARRRMMPGIADQESRVRSVAEHGSFNTPVQGTANEYCTASVNSCVDWIVRGDAPARIVLVIHDQIVFEADEDALDEVAFTVRRIMEGWNSGDVPLVVDMEYGDRWGSLQPYKEDA